jgi:uncharacterized protein YbjT (DUF2867 family)
LSDAKNQTRCNVTMTCVGKRRTRRILVTGATGYVGGQLCSLLEERGERLRCMARKPEYLQPRVAATTEVVEGDVLDQSSLERALAGIDTAFYLVHSMGSSEAFEEQDRRGALNFGRAGRICNLRRIIYLGGLGSSSEPLSAHLRSRQEVGRLLRDSGVPTIELRASIVIGAGSLSFEMVRALVERLPIMVTPRWVTNDAQPIAVSDLLDYLVAAIDVAGNTSKVYEIGGADRVSYRDIMLEYARQRSLRRLMIPVPVLSPRLSSLWLGLVTPLFARVGRKLIDSISHPTVVQSDAAERDFSIRPMGLRRAIAVALRDEDREAAVRWYGALSSGGTWRDWGGVRFGNRLADAREVWVPVPPERAFAPIRRIGGRTGWYAADWLWSLRGALDLLAGGIGMRRGRTDPEHLRTGDVVDCWRVERYEEPRRVRLSAEMKLPGRAWLEFEVTPDGTGSRIRQTAIFDPIGLSGLLYWYGIYPLHAYVFTNMLRGIASRASGSQFSSMEMSMPA